MAPRARVTVYLIHFQTPFKHARHYLGSTENLLERLEAHQKGNGSRLMEVIGEAKIQWKVSRTWVGDRKLERDLKSRKNGPRLCPLCREIQGLERGRK